MLGRTISPELANQSIPQVVAYQPRGLVLRLVGSKTGGSRQGIVDLGLYLPTRVVSEYLAF